MIRPRLSIIVPAYEEGRHVRQNLIAIAKSVEALGGPFEILLVDDGSRDSTASEADEASRSDPRIRVLRHETNLGKGAALATGIRGAAGEVLVFLDADLEISPDQIGPLLARFEAANAGVAVASKYLPGSSERRPLHRVLLSRLYYVVTAMLFRLPIRDTQTGLKVIRRDVAAAIVPVLMTKRYAWDIELLVLAHKIGARIVSGPVSVDFLERGLRIGLRGFLASGIDTLRIFWRDKALAGYGAGLRCQECRHASPRPARRPTRILISADDLGLSASVDRGVLKALDAGHVRSVSFLTDGITSKDAAQALRGRGPSVDVGVHLDLAHGRLPQFVAKGFLGLLSRREIRGEVRRQVGAARSLGLQPTHIDSHRHAFFVPSVYRAVEAEARALGLGAMRKPNPLGPVRCGGGASGIAKGIALALTSPWRFTRLAAPDGIIDAATAAAWVELGQLPRAARGRSIEVIAHPAEGPEDWPAAEHGIDRAAESRLLASPPLLAGLEALGAIATTFRGLA